MSRSFFDTDSPLRPSAPVIVPGAVLGHHEVIRELGSGGMGTVFLARDTRLGRLVAIKLLLEHGGPNAERFLGEARATALCRHENIVVIHDVAELGGYPYMVLEYIEGRTLRDVMPGEARPQATPQLAVELMIPVVRALARAHAMGIVHRDLKPENILLSTDGIIKVVDFGLAKQVSPAQVSRLPISGPPLPGDAGITQDGVLIGTMPYMSPEQWRSEPIDPRTDIWAAGILLHELALGAHPLDPLSYERLRTVADLDSPLPSAPDLPGAPLLAGIIDACLQKRKEQRLGSAAELLLRLERLVADESKGASGAEEGPFAGLAAFQEADAGRFFGRERDIAAVTARLAHQPLVAVAGPSGAGKSSFVRAGVIPALKRMDRSVESFVVRPGRRPLAALAELLALLDGAAAEAGAAADLEGLARELRDRPGMLGERLRARCRRGAPAGRPATDRARPPETRGLASTDPQGRDQRAVLFVDQLEELYTMDIEPAERAAFFACIEGVADDAASPLRVLLALRADFLERLTEDRRFTTEVTRGLVLLPPMDRRALHEALTRPLAATRHRFEDDALAAEMLDGLQGSTCPLPLLQFTATKLWEARDRENRLLTRRAYQALGGVAGALSTHADAVLAGLSPAEQRLARSILLRLVTPERTRAIVGMDELCALADDGAAAAQVVLHLAGARLLVIEAGGEGKTVEMVHESLVERWGRLRQWLDESAHDAQFLAQLRSAARQWEQSGHPEGVLWRDRAALEAGRWLDEHRAAGGAERTGMLQRREERYLEAVVGLARRTQRWRQRIGAGVILLLALIAVVVAYLGKRAGDQAGLAREEARQARNATRMAAARELQSDPTTALALLREVEGPDLPRGWAELARLSLYGGVARVVLEHPQAVRNATWSPDGARVVTGSDDGLVRVWSASGAGAPLLLRGHGEIVRAAEMSPDGARIASTSDDGTVRVWQADGSGTPLVLRHDGGVTAVTFSPDGKHIASASEDRTARIWSVNGGGEPHVLRGHDGTVFWVSWSPDGDRVVTSSQDGTARVWAVEGTDDPVVFRGHEGEIRFAAFDHAGIRIATASWDRTARVWSADGTGEPLVLRGHDNGVFMATFSPDDERIATASLDRTVRLWSADGTGEPAVLHGHADSVFSATWSPDGERLVSASLDGTARIWPVGAAAEPSGEPTVLRGHERPVIAVAWSPDGDRLASAAYDGTVRVWRAGGSGQALVLRGHEGWVHSVAWSPDGERILTASADMTARVWSADGAGEPLILRGHSGWLSSAAWSPDGRRIVTTSFDGTARLWRADGAPEPVSLRHQERLLHASFSPDGERVVTASYDGLVRVWKADGTGEPVLLRGHEGRVFVAAWSPDGSHILTASSDRTARVWRADGTGEPLILRGHAHWVNSAAWSPDGKHIMTASNDRTVRVWSAGGEGEPLVLRGATRGYNRAAWSPDGERIAAPSDDGSISIWSDLVPLAGVLDPRLWGATTYCVSVERRLELLALPEAMARAEREICMRHVHDAGPGEAPSR